MPGMPAPAVGQRGHRSGPAPLRLVPRDDPGRSAPKPLGVADTGPAYQVGLSVEGARHHVHAAGHTGGGKTTLLLNMILADASAGRGVAVLDPKGDLIGDVLDRLPASCGGRLVLIDPAETEAPPSLNVLDTADRDPELVTEHLVGVLHRLYADSWGPRIEDTLRAACRTLAGQPGTTLADVPLLLTNTSFRARHTARVRREDPEGLGAFWDGYDMLSPAAAAQACGPVLSKLRAILGRSFAAALLGTARSSFTMTSILDGGILLARLPKGLLGDDACQLIGSLLLAALWQAATTRAATPEHQRLDAAVYVDEAHNFLHLPIGLDDALAEARSYRLSFVLAHQHLAQLPRPMAEALHANARNKIFFTVSPSDAKVLAPHVGPYLSAEDLDRLGRFQVACRLVARGKNTTGFTLATQAAPAPVPRHAERLRADARAHGLPWAVRDRLRMERRIRIAATSTVATPAGSSSGSLTGSPADSVTGLETAGEPDTPPHINPQVRPPDEPSGQFRDWPV